jgi:hypothetical protein
LVTIRSIAPSRVDQEEKVPRFPDLAGWLRDVDKFRMMRHGDTPQRIAKRQRIRAMLVCARHTQHRLRPVRHQRDHER